MLESRRGRVVGRRRNTKTERERREKSLSVTVQSTGEADAAEHAGVERELPGGDWSRYSVVSAHQVQKETAGRHRVDGVRADGLRQVVEDGRQGVASHHEQEGGLDCWPGVLSHTGIHQEDNEDEAEDTDSEGGEEDSGWGDVPGLDVVVAAPEDDDVTDLSSHPGGSGQTLSPAVDHQVLVESSGRQKTFWWCEVIRVASVVIQDLPPRTSLAFSRSLPSHYNVFTT